MSTPGICAALTSSAPGGLLPAIAAGGHSAVGEGGTIFALRLFRWEGFAWSGMGGLG